MIKSVKVKYILDDVPPVKMDVVQKYEVIDAMWGIMHIQISDDDIKALKEGKYLYIDDGEYAYLLSYGNDSNKIEKSSACDKCPICVNRNKSCQFGTPECHFSEEKEESNEI